MIGLILDWLLNEILLPLIRRAEDKVELEELKKSCNESVQDLKNAQDKKSIDSAIDELS